MVFVENADLYHLRKVDVIIWTDHYFVIIGVVIVLLATLDPLVILDLDGDGLMVLVHLPCRSAFLPRILTTVVVPPKVSVLVIIWLFISPLIGLRLVSTSGEAIDHFFEVKDFDIDVSSSFLIS